MENFEMSEWVRSPEIAAYLQEHWTPDAIEQMRLVLGAFRPLAEKTNMLYYLQRFADSAEDREQIKPMWELYRLAQRVLEDEVSGNSILFLGKQLLPRPDIAELDVYGNTAMFSTYGGLMTFAKRSQWDRFVVEKYWLGEEEPVKLGSFDFEKIDGRLCAVDFCMEDAAFPPASPLIQVQKHSLHARLERSRLPLPFTTGYLVCLEGIPSLEEPVYGVLYYDVGIHDDHNVWLGRIRDGRLTSLDLSFGQIGLGGGYRVIDWLRPAEASMLPAGQELLAGLSAYLKGASPREAEKQFLHVFREDPGKSLHSYRRLPVTLEELFPESRWWSRDELGKGVPWWNYDSFGAHTWTGGWWLLDMETSGTDPLEAEIIALRLAYMEELRIREERDILVRPRHPLTPGLERLIGISNEALETAMPLDETVALLEELTPSAPLMVWSRSFDIPFLRTAFHLCGKRFTLPCLLWERLAAFPKENRERSLKRLLEHGKLPLLGQARNVHLDRLHTLAAASFRELDDLYGIHNMNGLFRAYGAEPVH